MTVIAVAGLGDMGKLIVRALCDLGKYEVYALSRKVPADPQPVEVLQTDYTSESTLADLLISKNVHTVICAMGMDFDAAAQSQLRLIRAAEAAPCVRRFVPSEFNVDYDLGDDVLPYPDKRHHVAARRELEGTKTLEYTYIYPGMFMDYFGMPHVSTHLRPLVIAIEPAAGVARIPGDGNAKVALSYTVDVARYTALAMGMDKWPKVLTIVASNATLSEIVAMIEGNLGRKLDVSYESVEQLLRHETKLLPGNLAGAHHFPGGVKQLEHLTADLNASMALGAYDFRGLQDSQDLIEIFGGTPTRIEDLLRTAWKGR